MFVGVVVENFHKCRESQEKEEKAMRAAKRAKKMEKKRRSTQHPNYPSSGWYRITESGDLLALSAGLLQTVKPFSHWSNFAALVADLHILLAKFFGDNILTF